MNPDLYDLYRHDGSRDPSPQKIFTEVDQLEELVFIRKQDTRIGLELRLEVIRTVVEVLEFMRVSGMCSSPAEQDQMHDNLKRILLTEEGR